MRRLEFLIVTVIILVIPLTSYGWTRTYGGEGYDVGHWVHETGDGGLIIVGETHLGNEQSSEVWLLKTDAWGDTLWTRTFGNENIDYGRCIRETSDGGYIIIGSTTPTGTGYTDLWLLKTDSVGDTLWTRTYGWKKGDYGESVQQTSGGGYIICGSMTDTNSRFYNLWLLKTDKRGDTVWTRIYGTDASNDYGYRVRELDDGGYVILGRKGELDPLGGSTWLLRTDAQGDTIWSYVDQYFRANDMCIAQDGGIVFTGWHPQVHSIPREAFIKKISSTGEEMWFRIWVSNHRVDEGYSVTSTTDGGYIVAALIDSLFYGGKPLWLIKTDEEGDTIWSKTYWGEGVEEIRCVQQTSDAGYIVTGSTASFGALGRDLWLVKTNAEGDTLWYDVSPVTLEKPQASDTIAYMIPRAWFRNLSSHAVGDFYCHCEIASSNFLTPDYHVKYWVSYGVEPGDSILVKFSEWASDDSATYTARFYTSKVQEPIWQTREKSVTFYGEPWSGVIEDQHVILTPCWELISSCGSQITLRYSNYPDGFAADVFDASGRRVDKLESADVSGTITWGACYGSSYGSGVYFIRVVGDQTPKTKRIVLIP